MTSLDLFMHAMRSLLRHRLRTLLSAGCIAIGIASVMTMLAVGLGARAKMAEMMNRVGATRIDVAAGAGSMGGFLTTGGGTESGPASKLNMRDLPALRRLPGVAFALPRIKGSGKLRAGKVEDTAMWEGVSVEHFRAFPFKWVAGRPFTDNEARSGERLAIISSSMAEDFFGKGAAVGKDMRLDGVSFRVVGVFDAANSGFVNGVSTVAVPLQAARQRLAQQGRPQGALDAIIVMAKEPGRLEELSDATDRALMEAHRIPAGRKADYSIFSIASAMKASQESDAAMSMMLTVIGVIALFIAGVGIMNVMLVALKERTREIGVARAIGASPAAIRRQFLVEALALTGVGSVVGIGLGVVATWGLKQLGTVAVLVNWWPAALAMVAAGLTGLAAGIYPAIRASKIHVIEALRTS